MGFMISLIFGMRFFRLLSVCGLMIIIGSSWCSLVSEFFFFLVEVDCYID